jgi:peptide/nickel transport system permease protein
MLNSISIKSITARFREFRQSLYLLSRNQLTFAALLFAVMLVVVAILAPAIIPYPSHISGVDSLEDTLLPPSADHFFGTDEQGRDIFSRVMFGTRLSLVTAIFSISLALLIGVPLGAIAGYSSKLVDEIIMRITDMFCGFPPMLLAIVIATFLGPSLRNAMLAIGISWWPLYTRLIRGQVVSLRDRQFVKAAKVIGTPSSQIIFRHILPNCIAPLIVQASLDMGSVILVVSALSFLGLGAQPPAPDWGLMISTSRNYFLDSWWYSVFPGLAIFMTVLTFNLLGDGFREILDPKTRNK